jgi:hypothetical protein
MVSSLSCLLFCFVFFAVGEGGRFNPIFDFCRRFGHMTAEVAGQLYLDGGFVNENPISQWPQNRSSKMSAQEQWRVANYEKTIYC